MTRVDSSELQYFKVIMVLYCLFHKKVCDITNDKIPTGLQEKKGSHNAVFERVPEKQNTLVGKKNNILTKYIRYV